MDPQFRNAIADGLNVSHQSQRQSLDSGQENAAHCVICKPIKPVSELRERPDRDHGFTVIDRLRNVKGERLQE
jgi:hypothetical protein